MTSRQIDVRIGQYQPITPTINAVQALLYDNFAITGTTYTDNPPTGTIHIEGNDVAGWTAETQLERLGSGLLFGEVIR